MPQSRPLVKNPLFVWVPPIVLAGLGIALLLQPGAFNPRHELIIEQANELKVEAETVAAMSLDRFDFARSSIDQGQSLLVVVNKQRPLHPLNYAPANLREMKSSKTLDNSRGLQLADQAATALEELAVAMNAEKAGNLFVNSAYRSYDYQLDLFQSKTKQYGLAGALIRSAKAGHSEHQTGLAVDVSVPDQGCAIMQCFGDTVGGQWLAANAWRHGFIIRYEEDTTAITGYTYEPWHLRFVGKQVAKLYTERGIHTLEEFWRLGPAPDYLSETTESTSN